MQRELGYDHRQCAFSARRHKLQRLFSNFPDGWPGVGLILLRLAVCSSAIGQGFLLLVSALASEWGSRIVGLILILVGLFVLVGFLTPVAGIAVTLSYGAAGVSLCLSLDLARCNSFIDTLDLSLASAALVMLGPGAYSMDARLFGRREIIIPESRRPPQ